MEDRDRFQPVRAAVALLCAARETAPDHFAWRAPPYEYEARLMPIDILWGHDGLRIMIDDGADVDEILEGMDEEVDTFRASVDRYLLYE